MTMKVLLNMGDKTKTHSPHLRLLVLDPDLTASVVSMERQVARGMMQGPHPARHTQDHAGSITLLKAEEPSCPEGKCHLHLYLLDGQLID